MITIYEVLAHDIVEYPDMDCVMQSRYEEVYDNMFTSRVNAIAKAQSLFVQRKCALPSLRLVNLWRNLFGGATRES